jgi:hypothetical protein
MTMRDTILPGTGRGTIRSRRRRMVEGQVQFAHSLAAMNTRPCPSTPTLRVAVPLPVPGRILT